MPNVFPEPILNLPEADLPFVGCQAFLSQGESHQILFMQFSQDVILPEHSHESQWGIVLEGKIELTINGDTNICTRGDRYFIEKDVNHSEKYMQAMLILHFLIKGIGTVQSRKDKNRQLALMLGMSIICR